MSEVDQNFLLEDKLRTSLSQRGRADLQKQVLADPKNYDLSDESGKQQSVENKARTIAQAIDAKEEFSDTRVLFKPRQVEK